MEEANASCGAYATTDVGGGGKEKGTAWRQVGSNAEIRVVHSVHSRRARHAVAAVVLALAGLAVVLTTPGPESGEQLAQVNTAKDTEGLAVQIKGIRAATQDVINSGAWDPKVRNLCFTHHTRTSPTFLRAALLAAVVRKWCLPLPLCRLCMPTTHHLVAATASLFNACTGNRRRHDGWIAAVIEERRSNDYPGPAER